MDIINLPESQFIEPFSLEMILDETKLPLVVALLVVVFNLKQLDSSVIKFIPKA